MSGYNLGSMSKSRTAMQTGSPQEQRAIQREYDRIRDEFAAHLEQLSRRFEVQYSTHPGPVQTASHWRFTITYKTNNVPLGFKAALQTLKPGGGPDVKISTSVSGTTLVIKTEFDYLT